MHVSELTSQKFTRLYQLLFQPSDQLPTEEDHHLAEGLAALNLANLVICTVIMLCMPLFMVDPALTTNRVSMSVSLVFYALSYALSRTRHYQAGGLLLIAATIIGVTVPAIATLDPLAAVRPPLFSPIAIFIAAYLFNLRATIITTAAIIFVQIPLIAAFKPEIIGDLVFVAVLNACFAILIGVNAKTKERHLRQIRQQQERVVAASKMSSLGEMAGGIAHEINNPLAVITMRASQIQRMLGDPNASREKAADFAGIIEATARRIAEIVQGLKDFSYDETANELGVGSVSDIIQSTLVFCSQRFNNHGVELRLDPIPETLQARCRPTQISQILLNLLNNAHDAVVTYDEKWIQIKVEASDDVLKLIISDSGVGIDSQVRQKIFEPFFTTKGIGKGTGIGLSISKGLAASNQGTLDLDLTQPHTTFVLTLKAAKVPPGSQVQAA